jgi:hypothetical protein
MHPAYEVFMDGEKEEKGGQQAPIDSFGPEIPFANIQGHENPRITQALSLALFKLKEERGLTGFFAGCGFLQRLAFSFGEDLHSSRALEFQIGLLQD